VLGRVDACRARLDRVPALLKRFRQSVLAAATSGKLTEEWREQHGNVTNAAKALAEIESTKQGKLRVQKSDGNLDALDLFEVPSKWSWVKNHQLAVDSNTAICAGPFGTIFKAKDFRSSGVPIIFLRHVAEGQYLTRKPGFMDKAVWKAQHQEYSVHGGELLVTKLGDPPGTACIYPEGIGVAMVTPDVMKMDVDQRVADPLYLMFFFNSPLCKDLVGQMAFGATRLRIDLTMFKNFPIPLPPRAEQQEIVRRVEALFAFADRIEARLATARKTVERLTPATLAKAFRGELVPQDPNDEPAAALLERLHAQTDPATAKSKRGRRAKSTSA
jgi:type I restriction enzyme S subunit